MSESTGTTNLEPVLISPVVGGKIRTWSEDETRLWSVDDPAALGALLGRGLVARTTLPDNKFREVAFLDTQTQALTVQPRFASPDSTALAAPFKLTEASAPTADAWEDLESTLASVAISAAGRGEFWLAELGGWDSPHEPNCLFTTVDESGLANAVMEPPPRPPEPASGRRFRADKPAFPFRHQPHRTPSSCRNLRGVSHRDLGRHAVGHQPHFRQTGRFRLIRGADTRR